MNIEDQAKKGLFDYDEFDIPAVYDPYRNNNILKDSNKPIDNFQKSVYRTFYHENKKENNKDRTIQNNRQSLKKLLQRLESLPSPDRKTKRTPNLKVKTVCISTTQPLITKKKPEIFVQNQQESRNFEVERQRIQQKLSRPPSTHIQTSMSQSQKIQQKQLEVRRLIKKKLAQKKIQNKERMKTQKLSNFTRQNCNSTQFSKKGESINLKINSRRLIDYLC